MNKQEIIEDILLKRTSIEDEDSPQVLDMCVEDIAAEIIEALQPKLTEGEIMQKLYDEIEDDHGHAVTARDKVTKGSEFYISYNSTANTDLKWMKRIRAIIKKQGG